KKNFNDKFVVDQFASFGFVNRSRVDTVRGTYNWYGNFTPRDGVGESPQRSLSDIDFEQRISRTNLSYRVNNRHELATNIVYNYSSRIGEDPYGFRFSGTDIDILSKEARYVKIIGGVSWESTWFDAKLT